MLRNRDVSARELAQAHLDRISKLDPQLGCFLTIDHERTLAEADQAQSLLDTKSGGPLTGVPYALKDNISTAGVRTTCASKILEDYVPVYDATVVEKLRGAGMVLLGKTNLDEFAMGTSTENSAFQVTRNPWDLARSPGGSSGGSAAAVAAELAPIAFGSDTGGSIRQPASLCGVVGFKPTYGRVSRYGLVAFGSSLDQIGPIARNVGDAGLAAQIISGHDPRECTSLRSGPIQADFSNASLRGIRFGIPAEIEHMAEKGEGIQPGVAKAWFEGMSHLTPAASFQRFPLPSFQYGVSIYYVIAPAEASSNLARFDGVRFGPRLEGEGHIGAVAVTRGGLFDHEVKARIMIGTYVLSAGYYDAYYVRAQQARQLVRREVECVFEKCDFIIMPTSPVTAFKLGELTNDPLALKLLDYCTIPANLGGFPAVSINCGFSDGLPVGLQIMGPNGSDERLLEIAHAIESALPAAIGRPAL